MTGPSWRNLPDGLRLHLQHGPIDLIAGAEGPGHARQVAFTAAARRFATILPELVAELHLLRRPATGIEPVRGTVAARMFEAVMPYANEVFVTPMAAVAGAVAETVLEAMCCATPLARAYVNNGGDIAFHLGADQFFAIGMASVEGAALGRVMVGSADPVRGIATSGWRGRSFSFGIADSVTVLADTACAADVAATLIANDVDLPGHPEILRMPACEIQPDSDLGPRLVTRSVGQMSGADVCAALDAGAVTAARLLAGGRIVAASLHLCGQTRSLGDSRLCQFPLLKEPEHA